MATENNTFREKAELIFNKRYKLKNKNDVYSLPEVNTMFSTQLYAIEPLIAIKNHLNQTKNLLNSKDIEKWRRHTGKTNPCGFVVRRLREAVEPELCTQAWAKFYELVSSCDVIPSHCIENKRLTTLHLCEAPGAFIASLNHYIKSNFDAIQWDWLASTLNPFYEGNDTKQMISGERFIIETLGHWKFGETNDGDLMQWENLESLLQALGGAGKVDIVTADGSISCADDPEKQELVIGQLLYCEVVAALVHLAPGGSLVVKMFTMFEPHTVGILYLLCCFFEEVEIIKPGTSKPGNSEVYCVCTLFAGAKYLSEDLLEKLKSHYTCTAPDMALFPRESLPLEFLESVYGCAKTFSEYQTNAINRNIELFENFSKGKWKFLTKLRKYLAEDYRDRFNVQYLKQELLVVPRMRMDGSQLSYWPEGSNETYCNSGTHHTGSLQERVAISKLGWHERVVFAHHEQSSSTTEDDFVHEILNSAVSVAWLRGPKLARSEVEHWIATLGKPIEIVLSSRFCSAVLIGQLNETRANANILHSSEGKQLIENLERLAEEKVHELNQASNICNIVDVLQRCGLLSTKSRPCFIDITGNGRFVSELLENGICYPKQCLAVLCEERCDDTRFEFERVLVNSCLGSDASELDRLENFGRNEDVLSRNMDEERMDVSSSSDTRLLETSEILPIFRESQSKVNQNVLQHCPLDERELMVKSSEADIFHETDTKLLETPEALPIFRESQSKVNQSVLQSCSLGHEKGKVKSGEQGQGVECLTSSNPRSTTPSCVETVSKPYRIILGSVFHQCRGVESHDELSSRVLFLNQCVTSLRLLEEQDCFVCEISDTLTQFTVGVIYVLHLLFKELSLVTPMFSPSSEQFIVCRGFVSSSSETTSLLTHLEKVSQVLTSKPPGKEVIGFVPINELFSEEFYKYIRTHSTRHVSAQLNCVAKCERLLLAKHAC